MAACRAVLFAQLVDDPSSHPDKFTTEEDVEAERQRLFRIIEELVIWENSTNEEVLERARAEIRKSCGGELPPIYDPFSGGGSIPLEAQRLGLPAYGSDLNPVAVMIGKAMIEIPPKFKGMKPVHPGGAERNHYRYAEGLAEDVKHYGEWIHKRAFERIGHLYPKVDLPKEYGGGKATVIAWIWSRTVPSPDPAFADVHVPIASSFALSTKKGKEAWIEPIVDKAAKTIIYRIRNGGTKAEIEKASKGTKAGRANFRCLISDTAITAKYIKAMGKAGVLGQQLLAIVADCNHGRTFLSPDKNHEAIALSANAIWRPETSIPDDGRAFTTPPYGLETFGDLFTERQLVALNTFANLVHEAREVIEHDAVQAGLQNDQNHIRNCGCGARAYSEAISVYLAFAVDRSANTLNTIARWTQDRQQTVTAFSRQAIPMSWDFPEVNPFSGAAGDYVVSVSGVLKGISGLGYGTEGTIRQFDAQTVDFPEGSVISSDPPYYDNIGYSDLSDFFFCWLRPALKSIYPDLFGILATPKSEELIASPSRHGGKEAAEEFFLNGMRQAIKNMAAQSNVQYPATIYYAFKQSEIEEEGISSTGWATFLQAVIEAGYSVVGTWPVRTELSNRMRGIGSNALASSVVLVCRQKHSSLTMVSRSEFIRALKRELPAAIAELQAANIAPADMPQSSIGPGMGIFSRYEAVLESDDSPMSVKAALQLINRELDEYLGGIEGEFDADTRFAITWFEQNGMANGDYGTANSIAQARGIAVESAKHAGIVESAGGKVRLIKRDDVDPDWDPAEDRHLTVWECCQHLIRKLETEGEFETAMLLKRMGSEKADAVKDLAYCLYDICSNKRKDAKEATSYNALIAVWSDLTKLAAGIHSTSRDGQYKMEV